MPAEIRVPPLGESLVDAVVGQWLKNEGDAVNRGETLVELETDKVNLDVAATEDGVLSRIERREGDVVKVGELREIENAARKALIDAFQGAPARAVPSLRLGLTYPALSLVPVDEVSAPPRPRLKALRADES